MLKRLFSLIELLIVVGIITFLMTLIFFNKPETIPGLPETKVTLQTIELAMESYKVNHGRYPFSSYEGVVNISNHEDPNILPQVLELLRLESFETDEAGYPVDHWGNPIYLILYPNYPNEPLSQYRVIASTNMYYKPRSLQLISGGPDGTRENLGADEDNIFNFSKK